MRPVLSSLAGHLTRNLIWQPGWQPGRFLVWPRRWSLTAKLAALVATLLTLALASIGLTLWITWQLDGGAAAINEAGRMRMQTYRMALILRESPSQANELARRFDNSLALLQHGDPVRPLFVPWNDEARARFAEVRQQWQVLRPRWTSPVPPTPDQIMRDANRFVILIDAFDSAIEAQLARWTAILNGAQTGLLVLAIGSSLALLYVGHLLVLAPVARLTAGVAQVEAGDFATRVEVVSQDEFGQLSSGFNRMARNLQQLYASLEQKVSDKTASLERERARLSALYEVSAFLAEAGTLDELAHGFAQRVRRIAGADSVAIRWSSEASDRYLLLAGDSLPSFMIEDEQCVSAQDCLCGQSQAQAQTGAVSQSAPPALTAARVIPVRAEGPGAARLGHCPRAGYATLVAVPVVLHQRSFGEIDLFFRSETALSAQDRDVLETLASHLASAVENLRVSALERETAVSEERTLLASELHDSIAQSLAFLKIQVQLLRDALPVNANLGAVAEAQVARIVDELDAGVRESTSDVRELLMHFRTRGNTEDIEAALRTTLRKFEHQTGLPTHLSIEGHGLPLAADVQVQVLHVLQEALSNVRKHAEAREVWLEVQRGPAWSFEVRDDGNGMDTARPVSGETHVGMRIMRERAARIGARVVIDSVPGAGTCVTLSLPPHQSITLAPRGEPERDDVPERA
ncbi:type IV pili methyl-accepting chemotaxis transducer N-terminal domain-containing protein [Paraburkholderia sp. DHOC27]|uniref:type IV pili methyl-accepting chemotaxis transducer N-terminal domain-containing protein n=1 Tax=Paraburkholderia sp. DHOC27 TaxID=2303330 RepID=UPI000E3C326E|nr:type IV pili methyl-accepting chemotaxis transducer N-terminal domain-containing protein [Paraburkholderia sp. DHOC27]RFU44098.1 HAMP domain-containing protein [Paraburkholderia sp. DHOC27]